ncbi:MAG: hypothetical protein ACUVRD_01930 [Bacteroidia bacterium]
MWSCQAPLPKPKTYPRIPFPDSLRDTSFVCDLCPIRFNYPAYGALVQSPKDSCWFDIYFPPLDCYWHITAVDLKHTPWEKALEIHRKLIYRHAQKAADILEKPLRTPHGKGRWYELYGDVPTPLAFYLSDSLHFATMISMYFKKAGINDSVAPIVEFMKTELWQTLQTLHYHPPKGLTRMRTCM